MKTVLGPINTIPITKIATKEVIVATADTPINEVCQLIVDYGIRRVPIVDSKSNKLTGIISARDIIDFLGGGKKNDIVKVEFKGDLAKAGHLPISRIMTKKVISISEGSSIADAAKLMLKNGLGGCPITDKENKIVGIVSEGDFIRRVADGNKHLKIEEFMSTHVDIIESGTTLLSTLVKMVELGRRRFPIVKEGEQVGVIRITLLLKYICDKVAQRKSSISTLLSNDVIDLAMSKHFISVRKKDTIEDLIEMMIALRKGGFTVEEEGKVIGIVTERDVFKVAYEN